MALRARVLKTGLRSAFRHVLERTLALLLIGILMVNAEEQVPARDGLSPDLWNVLMTVGVLLAFWARPSKRRWDVPRLVGAALVLASVFLYRTDGGSGIVQIRPQWWGILGLIGWAYLVAGGLYLVFSEEVGVYVGALGLLCALCLADEAGDLAWIAAVRPYLEIGRLVASHAAIAVAGVALAVWVGRARASGQGRSAVLRGAFLWGAGLLAAGALLHSLHGLSPAFSVNKIRATVPWCLFSAGATCLLWAGLQWVGLSRWPRLVVTAGENALLAFLLAPLVLSLFQLGAGLLGTTSPDEVLHRPVWVGLLWCGVFSCAIVAASGALRRRGLRLQL